MFFERWVTSGRGLSCLWRLWWNISRIHLVCSNVFHPLCGEEMRKILQPSSSLSLFQTRGNLCDRAGGRRFLELLKFFLGNESEPESNKTSRISTPHFLHFLNCSSSSSPQMKLIGPSWNEADWSFCRMDVSDWRLEIQIFIFYFLFFIFFYFFLHILMNHLEYFRCSWTLIGLLHDGGWREG